MLLLPQTGSYFRLELLVMFDNISCCWLTLTIVYFRLTYQIGELTLRLMSWSTLGFETVDLHRLEPVGLEPELVEIKMLS